MNKKNQGNTGEHDPEHFFHKLGPNSFPAENRFRPEELLSPVIGACMRPGDSWEDATVRCFCPLCCDSLHEGRFVPELLAAMAKLRPLADLRTEMSRVETPQTIEEWLKRRQARLCLEDRRPVLSRECVSERLQRRLAVQL